MNSDPMHWGSRLGRHGSIACLGWILATACNSELSLGDGDGGPNPSSSGGSGADVHATGGAGGASEVGTGSSGGASEVGTGGAGGASEVGTGGAGGASEVGTGGAGGATLIDGGPYTPGDFAEFLPGIWLFGWSADMDHYSWIRFSPLSTTATDPATPGDGTIDVLAGGDATPINLPFWMCSGRGQWFLTQMPAAFTLELPATCGDAGHEIYTITRIDSPPSYLPGCLRHITMTRSSGLVSLEACQYPASQCSPEMTTCLPVRS